MKLVKTVDAVGQVLCHDLTQIIPGVSKDAVFRKGHVVTEKDIPVLRSIGKEHLYIWEKTEGMLHENEAALLLADLCKNRLMRLSPVKEGKIELIAEEDGLFLVDVKRLEEINSLDEIMIATRFGNAAVKKGDRLAGTRVIPLVIAEEKLREAKRIAGEEPLLEILPFEKKKVGIVTTGTEIASGRIQDAFGPVLRGKMAEYDCEILGQRIVSDAQEEITAAIKQFLAEGAEMILCSGGMSVDPDDRTPSAIRESGAEIVSYGAPVLPGAMFLLSYYKETVPILGLPGCVMYAKRTVFDLLLPRILAGIKLTKKDLAKLGYGGLCLSCQTCNFPNCSFAAK